MNNAAAGKKNWSTKLIAKIKSVIKTRNDKQTVELPYHSLSPIDNADPDGHYSNALLWALQCTADKDIKNIALTGPYGSGKSSILRTFEKAHGKQFKFLRISLATFKDPNVQSEVTDSNHVNDTDQDRIIPQSPVADDNKTESDLLRLIEFSILQQIFYHENARKLPDSRIKRTKSYKRFWMAVLSAFLFFYFTSILYLWKPDWIIQKFFLPGSYDYRYYYQAFSLTLFVLGTISIVYAAVRPFRSIRINKFSIQDIEFSLDSKIDRSILNKHLDEILYFFQVTKYNVVIIEDLDRFEQTEIFTKLRELNHLINYSKEIQRKRKKVVFIYAVRENMFHSKDRIKFFDFIIPVIPIVDASNSNEMMGKVFAKVHHELNKDFLFDISMFIDDMRLMHNIMNEYMLYSKNLKEKLTLEPNKLLALVLYKNLYPTDFVDISNNKGVLHSIFALKEQRVASAINKLSQKIEPLNNEIKKLKTISIKDLKELRKLYVFQYLAEYPFAKEFVIDDKVYSFEAVLEGDIFDQIVNDNFRYISVGQDGIYEREVSITFEAIARKVDKMASYQDRVDLIKRASAEKIESLKDEITIIERQITTLRYKQIKDHMQELEDLFEIKFQDDKQSQLLRILLRNGYIDETYSEYVSLFHEGTFSRTDKEFVLNVKAHVRMKPDYKLDQVEIVVAKLKISEFEKDYVLNFKLVNYLVTSGKEKPKFKKLIQVLSNGTSHSIDFINQYLANCSDLKSFFYYLTNQWPNIWKVIESDKSKLISKDLKENYFKSIISYGAITDIKTIANRSALADYCANKSNFLSIVDDTSRIKEIITSLNLKFKNLDLKNSPSELVEFVYESSFYDLNVKMVSDWMKYKDIQVDTAFFTENYSTIFTNKDKLEKLYEYIHSNMELYINQVWLEVSESADEDSSVIPRILNDLNLTTNSKKLFLERNKTVLYSLKDISDIETMQLVLSTVKLEISWNNVLLYFESTSEKFDKYLVAFLNNEVVAETLSKDNLLFSFDDQNRQLWESFVKRLVRQELLKLPNYLALLRGISQSGHFQLDYDGLKEERVLILIRIGMITLNPRDFQILHDNYPGLHINLVAKSQENYLNESSSYAFDVKDVPVILQNIEFNVEVKNKVIEGLSENSILHNEEIQNSIVEYLKGEKKQLRSKFPLKKEILTRILLVNSITLATRREILIIYLPSFSKHEFVNLMQHWGHPYYYIGSGTNKVTFEKSPALEEFAQKLLKEKMIERVESDNDMIYLYNY